MWLSLIIDKTFYSFIRAENWENLLWGGATSISDGIFYGFFLQECSSEQQHWTSTQFLDKYFVDYPSQQIQIFV